MKTVEWRWPGGKKGAILFNICLEAWSDGKAPGIGPMGNPLPPSPGVLDTNAISWAEYGAKRGIYRLLDGLGRSDVKASVMTNAVLAHIFGRPGGVWVVDRIAEIVAGSRELWTGTRAEMAAHILSLGAQIPVERGNQG